MSGKCFSNVRMNLSHSEYKGSICMLFFVLICLASLFALHIITSCAFLVWFESTKEIFEIAPHPSGMLNCITECDVLGIFDDW